MRECCTGQSDLINRCLSVVPLTSIYTTRDSQLRTICMSREISKTACIIHVIGWQVLCTCKALATYSNIVGKHFVKRNIGVSIVNHVSAMCTHLPMLANNTGTFSRASINPLPSDKCWPTMLKGFDDLSSI